MKTYVDDRPGHDRRYLLDRTKLEREFGWRARVPFAEGLIATIEWFASHRALVGGEEGGPADVARRSEMELDVGSVKRLARALVFKEARSRASLDPFDQQAGAATASGPAILSSRERSGGISAFGGD